MKATYTLLPLQKLTHALMGFPHFNLTVVAKMDEMGVLAKMEEGQA